MRMRFGGCGLLPVSSSINAAVRFAIGDLFSGVGVAGVAGLAGDGVLQGVSYYARKARVYFAHVLVPSLLTYNVL